MRDQPILILRGKGTSTVWVDRIGAGIGDVLRDRAVITEGVDAGHRAVAVITILAGEGKMGRLPIHDLDTRTVVHIESFQRSQRAWVFAQRLLWLPSSPDEEPYG